MVATTVVAATLQAATQATSTDGAAKLNLKPTYEEQAILGCAVEGDSSSHHGGRHGAGNHELYGIRTDCALGAINKLKNLHQS